MLIGSKMGRTLLAFVGSVDPDIKYTTIGDLMAVYNVAKRLRSECKSLQVAWSGALADLTVDCLPLDCAHQGDYDHLVYVCGPLHGGLAHLFSKFRNIQRVAVGVSIPEGFDPYTLVDAAFVRDAPGLASFDLALADIGYPHFVLPPLWQTRDVNYCFVGAQGEYGGRSNHELAEKKILRALKHRECIGVTTLLSGASALPASVELELQSSKVLVTTRLHGTLIGAFHGIAVVPVDQVKNGAKVTAIASRLGLPVLNAWDSGVDEIQRAIENALSSFQKGEAAETGQMVRSFASDALDEAVEFTLGCCAK